VTPVRIRFRFRGRVQGVGFRQYVAMCSHRLRIGGFVENRPDGSVVAELEGELAALQELERLLREEHPTARVDGVTREEMAAQGSVPPVRIR